MIPRRTLAGIVDAVFPDNYTHIDEQRDLRRVFFGSPEGMRVLARLAERSGWLATSPPQDRRGADAPMQTAYDEGRRSVMQQLANLLEIDHEPKAEDVGRDDER